MDKLPTPLPHELFGFSLARLKVHASIKNMQTSLVHPFRGEAKVDEVTVSAVFRDNAVDFRRKSRESVFSHGFPLGGLQLTAKQVNGI